MDWAEPEKDVDEEVMQRVRVLYVSVKVCVVLRTFRSIDPW